MRKIYLILVAVFTVIFASCTDNGVDGLIPDGGGKAPIINTPEGANQGEIMVKFKPEVTSMLDKAQARAARGVMTRSGIPTLDEVLGIIDTYKFERIFPVDTRNEERTRQSGLHLWYVVHFNKDMDLSKVADDLSRIGEIAKIEFSHNIKRAYNPETKPTFLSKKARTAMSRNARSAIFNDMDLSTQWSYINDGSALRQGELNERGDEIAPAIPGVDVNCVEAWKLCTGDPSIIVAILDEGVMWEHPDLKDNMWVNEKEVYASKEDADGNGYTGDKYGYNFVSDIGFISYDGTTDTGHGTHVAGTIAAVNNNNLGVCGIAGGNGTKDSGVKIMTCQVFSGNSGVTLYQEAKAIKYATDNGAVVLQCSWGYNSGYSNPLMYSPGYTTDKGWVDGCPLEKEALDYFIHNAGSPNGVIEGGIAVFAGGNEYAPMAGYPGAYPDYISVAAVAADGTPASYTNFGPGINISAPGGDSEYHKTNKGKIYSTLPPSLYDGESYGYLEGTSMACPHVSGVIALGLSYAAKMHRHFRAADFKALVLKSVNDVDSYFADTKTYWSNYEYAGMVSPVQMEPVTYKNKMGNGLIDAAKLLNAVAGGGVEIKVPNVYVSLNGTTGINFTKYFKEGANLTYSCHIADGSVTKLESTDNKTFTVSGLKLGSTKVTVTASDNRSQDFYVTVRKTAGGNGWM